MYKQKWQDLHHHKELITTFRRLNIIDQKTYQNIMLEIIQRLLIERGTEIMKLKEELNKPDPKNPSV